MGNSASTQTLAKAMFQIRLPIWTPCSSTSPTWHLFLRLAQKWAFASCLISSLSKLFNYGLMSRKSSKLQQLF
jgi:hypothetical protein